MENSTEQAITTPIRDHRLLHGLLFFISIGFLFSCFVCSPFTPPYVFPFAPHRSFDMSELLVVPDIAPDNWILGPMKRAAADGIGYDEYVSRSVEIYDGDLLVVTGYIALLRNDQRTSSAYNSYKRYEAYMPEFAPPAAMLPDIQSAEQWDFNCEYNNRLNIDRCLLMAGYEEFLFLIELWTEDSFYFEELPAVEEQFVIVIEAQDQHIGTMLNLKPATSN